MRSILEQSLRQLDSLPIASDRTRLVPDSGVVGSWRLDRALKLAVEVVSHAGAQSGKWLTYEVLQKRLNAKAQKPLPPNQDDPAFDPPHLTYDTPEERLIAKQYRYQQALRAYEIELQQHYQSAAETEAIRQRFGYGMRNYLAYAEDQVDQMIQREGETATINNPLRDFLEQPRTLPIPNAAAEYGTFIVGNHGSGKSEVIKQRVWHFLNQPEPRETVIVIDPHGQMASEIARMKPNYGTDRLVYLDPTLDPEFVPCPEFLQSQARNDDELYQEAEHYGEAIRMMAGSVDPSATGNMEAICRNCAHVILEHDHYRLPDLLDLLSTSALKPGAEGSYPDIYMKACQSLNPAIAQHFEQSFLHRRNYTGARDALAIRIERIIASPILQRMLFGPSSFNLAELMEQRKVIVINLPFDTLSRPVTRMIAQLFMAQISLAILQRDLQRIDDYAPVHVFIDEAQHVVSHATATEINEFRKYKFNLTLATQYTEQFPADILEAVKGLGVQIAGYCIGKNLETMNGVFELSGKSKDEDETTLLQNQDVGHFYFRSRGADGAPPIKTRQFVTDTNLLISKSPWREQNAERYMTEAEWEETKAQQLAEYYRPLTGFSNAPAPKRAERKAVKLKARQAPKPLDPGPGFE